MDTPSGKTVYRLSQYRRVLQTRASEGKRTVYSHELADLTGFTAAQVRRDLMAVGYVGSTAHGYDVLGLMNSIGAALDGEARQSVALVGAGSLGRAMLAHFRGRGRKLKITAAFDHDPDKADRTILGCRCYRMEELAEVVEREDIRVGIITVPADQAQGVCDLLVQAGVRGILDFTTGALRVPTGVHVDTIDLITVLEKVAYFARAGQDKKQ